MRRVVGGRGRGRGKVRGVGRSGARVGGAELDIGGSAITVLAYGRVYQLRGKSFGEKQI